jgi:hypothetical protein
MAYAVANGHRVTKDQRNFYGLDLAEQPPVGAPGPVVRLGGVTGIVRVRDHPVRHPAALSLAQQ